MSVHLVPDKNLHFHGPFTQPVQTTLTITNENPTSVAFKVKTTRTKEQQRSSPTHYGKFLIQSAFIKPEYAQDLQCIVRILGIIIPKPS
ncbi:hypothetical protein OG21DRAFT_1605651 [Imleria badia]|nr:hypothetical protein OG21DRAFT_1605651 [Imleria badia]